jgi:hypothetical protein
MIVEADVACFGEIKIPLREFPDLLTRFGEQTARYKVDGRSNFREQTLFLEQSGASLIRANFPEEGLIKFIKDVCKWGNYPGIAARVCRENPTEKIVGLFRDAQQALSKGRIVDGLAKLQNLNALGGISFASKHLKFLAPDKAVVLDSIVESSLGYAMNRPGYINFLADCPGLRGRLADLAEFKRRISARYKRAVHGDRESYMDDAVFIFSEAKTVLAEKLAES